MSPKVQAQMFLRRISRVVFCSWLLAVVGTASPAPKLQPGRFAIEASYNPGGQGASVGKHWMLEISEEGIVNQYVSKPVDRFGSTSEGNEVRRLLVRSFRLTKDELEGLRKTIEESNFFACRDHSSKARHYETSYIKVYVDDVYKSAKIYGYTRLSGDESEDAERFMKLWRKLEDLVPPPEDDPPPHLHE